MPPAWFGAESSLVSAMRSQWRETRLHTARPLDRAYWCLTLLRSTYGGYQGVARTLHVSHGVLDRLRQLTSAEDLRHGRKVGGHGVTSVTDEDLQWLNAMMPRLILRVAEVESGLQDLPQINKGTLDG